MADRRKGRPGVWAKALAKFLGGDDRCWYKIWLQSTHWVDKLEKTPEDQARMQGHMDKHDGIANRRASALRSEGYVVKTEDETTFKVSGKNADLTGKCDVVAMKDGEAIVDDAKGGRPREADHWQVRIYMWALPLTWLQGHKISGGVQYTDNRVDVRPPGREDLALIAEGVRRATTPEAPATTPSK